MILSLLPFFLLLQSVQSFVGSRFVLIESKNVPTFLRIKSRFMATSSSANLDYLELVREGLQEACQEDAWDEATRILMESTRFSNEDAQDCLAQALNWKNWARCKSKIAKRYIKPKPPPDAQTLQAALEWLQGEPLNLNDPEELQIAILSSPEPYLLRPEESYQKALQVAPSKYKNPSDFARLVLANPSALGCVYNCVNAGCNSECGSCWVSFESRASLARNAAFDA
jgi:hypothetical protein